MEQAEIKVFKVDFPHAYPWRFKIKWKGGWLSYGGIPNYCETKRQATSRAVWRKRWLENGIEKYQ